MLRILSVSIVLSFLMVTPAFADDDERGFFSNVWGTVSSYFSDDGDKAEKEKDKKKVEKDSKDDEGEKSEELEKDKSNDLATPTPTPAVDTVAPSIKIQQTV